MSSKSILNKQWVGILLLIELMFLVLSVIIGVSFKSIKDFIQCEIFLNLLPV